MIILDTEATCLTKPLGVPLNEQPYLVEFAGIKVDRSLREVSRLEFICNPETPLPPDFIRITGITEADLRDKKPLVTFYPPLVDFFLGEKEMVAHNVDYDSSVIQFSLMRLGKLLQFPWPPVRICTVEASLGLKHFRLNLSKLHEIVTGKPHKDAHRAMADTEALLTCVRWLRKKGHL
jgi:DNA polymerase III epsilon subunit-like protein